MTILLSRLVLVTTLTLLRMFTGLSVHQAPAAGAAATAAYQVGDRLRPIQGLDVSRPMLVVFVRAQCAPCTESMDFYKTIAAGERRARLVAVSDDGVEALSAYLTAQGFEPDQALSVPSGALRVEDASTLLFVDKGGAIAKLWTGALTERDRGDVVRAIH